MSTLPGIPPDSVDVTSIGLEFVESSFALKDFGATTLAAVVVESRSSVGQLRTLPTPSGWTLLDSEELDGTTKWWAFGTTSPAAASRTFTFSDPGTSDVWSIQVHYTYLSGGTGGGAWGCTRGTRYDGYTKSGYAEPPANAAFWQQFGVCGNTWTEVAKPAGVVWTPSFGGQIAVWAYPCADMTGATFQSSWLAADPLNEADDGVVDWTGLGAYGWYGSRAIALSWTP